MLPYSYYVGLDLGQSRDYTALSLVEEPVWVPAAPIFERRYGGSGWVSPSDLDRDQVGEVMQANHETGRPPHPPLSVRHLERFELGTRYPRIVERVGTLLSSAALHEKRVVLLVDKTGVGGAVVDAFEQAGLYPVAITIHGGSAVGVEANRPGYRVPKRDLVSAVQVLLQNERLKIARALPEAETLRNELLNFRMKVDPKTAHDSYEHWRENEHDDLVLATAMACWFRQWWNANLDYGNALSTGAVV